MKSEYSKLEIRSYTGGADPRGMYAELELIEYGFSDDTDPDAYTGEEEIHRFVRRDLYAALETTNAELLAALKEIISLTDRDHVAFTRAKAAIAKAEGGK